MSRPVWFLILCLAGLVLPGPLLRPASAFTLAEAKAPMTATLMRSDTLDCGADCPEWLALRGRIGFETPAILSAAIVRLKGRKIPVLLDSPGGESTAGLAMGRMIRAAKLDTAVATTVPTECGAGDVACSSRLRSGVHPGHVGGFAPAACASACVLVLAGGVTRAVPSNAYVGVHQALRIQTFHPVMNTFRILKRRVGNRVVEVSRTLVASRALPTRVVRGAAPESLYSAFDRFLLGVGIGETIMPLMRATPPSGIHWMSRTELIQTRIATNENDGATFVRQEADDAAAIEAAAAARRSAQTAAAAYHPVPAPVALSLNDNRRWTGTVTWRIDATTHPVPVLVGDWSVPARHIHGAIEIVPELAQTTESSFTLSARFTPDAVPGAATVLAFSPPRVCDLSLCVRDIPNEATLDQSAAVFGVARIWRDDFLKQLHKRDWLVFDLRTDDGWGQFAVTLSSLDNHAIDLWEKLCCGSAAADDPWTAPATQFPALPNPRRPFLIAGYGAVTPVAGPAQPAVRTLDAVALYDVQLVSFPSEPDRLKASATWTPFAEPGRPRRPDAAVVLGEVDVPDAGLHLRLQVKTSAPGVLGRLTLEVNAAFSNSTRFGSPSQMTVMTIDDRHRHPLLFASSVTGRRWDGGYVATFDIPETGPIAGALQLAFEDAAQRRITVAVPIDPTTAALLQGAARGDDPAGS